MSQHFILFAAALLTALITGLLFAYSCSVNPGLQRLPDSAYLSAMQSINKAILNPAFFICFLGPALLLPLSAWLHYGQNTSTAFWYLCGAALLYILGVICVTMMGNVPLNEGLENFQLQEASSAQMAAQRSAFEGPWNSFHLLRTLAAVGSLALTLLAIFARNRLATAQ